MDEFNYSRDAWYFKGDFNTTEKTYYKIKPKEELDKFDEYVKKNDCGNCFQKNYELFIKLSKTNPYIKYVILQIRFKQSNNRITHALCIDGDYFMDNSGKIMSKVLRENYELTNSVGSFDILAYSIYDIHNIQPLHYYLNIYKKNKGMFIKGKLPRQKGKWEVAKDNIINL
jgi:hypothetical protein